MTTIHANSCRDALARLESMVAMANFNLPEKAVRQQIAAAIGVVVQVSRLSDGTRRVVNLAEITGMENDVVTMQDIFTFVRRGIGPERVGDRIVPAQRHPAEISGETAGRGHYAAA